MKSFKQTIEKLRHVCLSLATVAAGTSLLGGTARAQQSVSLQWSGSAGAAGYALYVGPAFGYYTKRIDVKTNVTVTVTGLASGTTNCFVVTAYNSAGLESPASNLAQFLATTTNLPPTNTSTFTTAPLSITNNGKLLISAPGIAGQTWLLQGSTNLSSWTSMYTNAAGQALAYTNALPSGYAWHYYRAVGILGTVNAASIASALSNHYFSENAVGFVKINAGRGEILFANPFDCGDNTVAALLPSVQAGSVVYRYTTSVGYSSNIFANGHWSDSGMTMEPGDGAFFYNPTRTTEKIIFAGRVLANSVTNYVPTGYSVASPMIPLPNSLSTLPTAGGDVIQCYSGKWVSYTNVSGAWVGAAKSTPLVIQPGNAFFITKHSPVWWVQTWTDN